MWEIDGHTAVCQAIGLSARIDLLQPHAGLFDVCVAGERLLSGAAASLRILRVQTRPSAPGAADELSDCCVRGADLVATYRANEPDDACVKVCWRIVESGEAGEAVGVELLASVETSLPRGKAALTVSHVLPADEVWRLAGEGFRPVEEAGLARGRSLETTPRDGAGLFLFRLGREWASYAAIVHPADFSTARLSLGDPVGGWTLSLGLFPDPLEKGLIRRARVQGLFVPRSRDRENALDSYRRLVDAPPPLAA